MEQLFPYENRSHTVQYLHQCTCILASNQALPPVRYFQFACKKGKSLVYFDHVLDVVGRGFQLAVDFAYALRLPICMLAIEL